MLFRPAYAVPTPPFTQCPAVGLDTSCAILIVFNSDGTVSILSDSTQRPFDGGDDTLIGVQNNRAASVPVTVLFGTNIFGFDGDGICSQFISPHPSTCPFGSTGYEGPGTSFTIADINNGQVNFAGGIASGGSTYFSLEGSLTPSTITLGHFILAPMSATNNPGGSHTVTATLTDGVGSPLSSITVTFRVTSGPNTGLTGMGITGANGQATFTYVDTGGVGTDTLVATFTDTSQVVHTSNTVTKTWSYGSIVLGPLSATNPVGTSHTVTAIVTQGNGSPANGVSVNFNILSGPNNARTGTGTTNSIGQTPFTYIDTGGLGTDTIVATFTDPIQAVHTSNTVTKTWSNGSIALGPLMAANLVGTSHTVTATVLGSTGHPLASITVTFSITNGPNAGRTGTGLTDANGQTTFTYLDTVGVGTDTIVASFTDNSHTVHTSNTATKTWVSAGAGGIGQSYWSPFGPATPNLIIHDYSDPRTMFAAFQNGQVDVTDWPIRSQDMTSFCTNPDIWCSGSETEFGISQADINNHAPFLGTAMQTARPSLTGSVVVSGTSTACSTGFGQLTLTVVNIEDGNQLFKDSVNQITIANQPSGIPSLTENDEGGASPTGTYVFPCILAGTYQITSSIVTGDSTAGTHLGCGVPAGCTVTVGSGQSVTATWNVVWNSRSTVTPTAAMPNIMKALAHLVDKAEFALHDLDLNGAAVCDDTFLSPASLIQGSPCVPPGASFPPSVINSECGPPIAIDYPPCAPISAYHLADANTGANAIWWGVPGRTVQGGVASGYASSADIDAACQYLVVARFVLSPSGSTCFALSQASIGTTQPATYPHFIAPAGTHFLVFLPMDPPRAHFGQIIADTINMLFGTPNDSGSCPPPCTQTSSGTATVLYYRGAILSPMTAINNIAAAVPIILGDGGGSGPDTWNMYAGGTSLGAVPDSLFSNYNSQFASTACGGVPNLYPKNYNFHCDPVYDAISRAAELQQISAPTLAGSTAIFQNAALRAYNVPIGVAMYSRIQRFAALNSWNWQSTGSGTSSSLVIQKGHGTQTGFWTLLNARQLPGYTPTNPIYAPGGGNPNLIRRGFSQDPDTVNPYQATTLWDFEILSQVFDSMLRVNPETAGANQQVIDWMTTSHSSTFNPNELGCMAGPSVVDPICVKGITTQIWHLRNDLFFHDGTQVTAQDVVYSILTQRDDPSANGLPSVAFVTNAVALDPRTVQVKLESNSAYYELNIGGVPIIPQHLWQGPAGSICGSISAMSTPAGPVNVVQNGPASACADPGFDPLTCIGSAGIVAGCGTSFSDGSVQGIFVGSGPYVCNNVGPSTTQAFGRVGGSCIQSSTGALIGGRSMSRDSRVLLTAYTNYMRGLRGGQGNSLQKESWADFNKDGRVNILDVSSAAFFFDSTNSYWAHPQYSCSSTSSIVDICDVSAMVTSFDEGTTAPFGGNNANPSTQLVRLDPQVDPYSMQLTGTNTCLYYQTSSTSATKLVLVSCGTSGIASLPTGHTITDSAAVLNADGTLGAAQSGTVTISGGTVTNSWSPGLTHGTQYEIRIFDNGVQIGQYFATP